MKKLTGSVVGFVMGAAVGLGYWFIIPGQLLADEAPAAPAAQTVADEVIIDDEFNTDGALGEWTGIKRVNETDVKAGHVLMVNNKKEVDAEGDPDPSTHLAYHNIATASGNITFEVKFDEFATNKNSRMEVNLSSCAAPGNAFVINRMSTSGGQKLELQVVGDGVAKPIAKSVPYPGTAGVIKLQITAKTGELRSYYKVNAADEFKEMPGSPCISEAFKEGACTAVVVCHNFGTGGPASVKLDYAKVTGPANKS